MFEQMWIDLFSWLYRWIPIELLVTAAIVAALGFLARYWCKVSHLDYPRYPRASIGVAGALVGIVLYSAWLSAAPVELWFAKEGGRKFLEFSIAISLILFNRGPLWQVLVVKVLCRGCR